MKKFRRNPVVGVRISPNDLAAVDALAAARGCSRSEALRLALSYGIKLAGAATSVNVRRYAAVLEFLTAAVGTIIQKEYPDELEFILDAVDQRLEEFHG